MSVSVFNLVSKLFNVPLLNVTASFVAEEQALASMQNENFIQAGQGIHSRRDPSLSILNIKLLFLFRPLSLVIAGYGEKKKALPSVSSSLVLAAGLGLAEAVALTAGSGYLMNIMGISVVCLTLLDICYRFSCFNLIG